MGILKSNSARSRLSSTTSWSARAHARYANSSSISFLVCRIAVYVVGCNDSMPFANSLTSDIVCDVALQSFVFGTRSLTSQYPALLIVCLCPCRSFIVGTPQNMPAVGETAARKKLTGRSRYSVRQYKPFSFLTWSLLYK